MPNKQEQLRKLIQEELGMSVYQGIVNSLSSFNVSPYKAQTVKLKTSIEQSLTTAITEDLNSKFDLGLTQDDVARALKDSTIEFTFTLFGNADMGFDIQSFVNNLESVLEDRKSKKDTPAQFSNAANPQI